ncbi:MAG: hypothetical protein WC379_05200 [Methanoregula sp.]|jgi:hypothetical protein
MESLESKLDRLSPEQRKETEDFVDFLLSRSGQVYDSPNISRDPPPVLNMAPPPLSVIEPVHVVETRVAGLRGPDLTNDRAAPVTNEEVSPAPFQEIDGGIQGRITYDYMDYGQFDSPPSPATEAVNKVKRKIIARDGEQKPRHLLDWVD